jgi:predicted tellurium resistance membrane protein TerC
MNNPKVKPSGGMRGYQKKKKLTLILFCIIGFIGFIMILDGVFSIIIQPEEGFLFQCGRVIRIMLGFIIICMVMYMIRPRPDSY